MHFVSPKDAIAALRKRITSNLKNFHVINLSLTVSVANDVTFRVQDKSQVLETASKNCGIRFHTRIAQKDFLQDLLKVISPKVKMLNIHVYFILTMTTEQPSNYSKGKSSWVNTTMG